MGSGSWRWESRFSEVRVCGCGIFACKIKALLKLKNFSNMCFFLLSLPILLLHYIRMGCSFVDIFIVSFQWLNAGGAMGAWLF